MLPLCMAFSSEKNVSFCFIATKEITAYRKKLGYVGYNDEYDFVLRSYESEEKKKEAKQLCDECDVLIYGSAPFDLVRDRLKTNKLTFRYSERVYKKPCPWYQIPLRAVKYNWMYGRNKNLYLLCASAYTAGDYAKTRTFLNRAFKWGYFPAAYEYDIDVLMAKKEKHTITWAARLIDWKHPEIAVEMARRLRADGIGFVLNMIGSGTMENEMRERVEALGLEDYVHILGSMSPGEVRTHMEKSAVFLMTSDRQEGWGAVLNEAQNSACAVLANGATGAAPYLIRDGENGFLYSEKNIDDMYETLKLLLLNEEKREAIGRAAYLNIHEHWNAEVAAKRLIAIAEALLAGEKKTLFYEEGICSKAEISKDG